MNISPPQAFSKACITKFTPSWIEILNLDQKIRNIIETTDFNYLKKKEDTEGFEERVGGKFFNKGKSNQWKKKLTNKQQNIIEKKFFKTISSLGYEHAIK